MSLKDVSPVVMRGKTTVAAEVSVNFLMPFAPLAEATARCLSNPEMTAPFIAAIVFPAKDNPSKHEKRALFVRGAFFALQSAPPRYFLFDIKSRYVIIVFI